MAYDANPLREENQQVSPNVLSPQAQQQQTQMQEQGAELAPGSGQSSTITPGQSGGSQSASQQRKDKPKSGMSANLRQYIQANKPQTQRIAQAATKDVTQQAQSIGAQVEKQKQAQQQQIQQNVQQREQAGQFAQNLLKQASQTGQIDTSGITRFRNLAQGKETFDAVKDLDLTRQDIDAKRLQQTAEAARTAKGQADILRDTFSRQGRQYTRGQSGLDRLLLAGDEGARQQVQAGAQAGAQQTAQGLDEARKTALQRLSELRSQNEAFAQELQSGAMEKKQATAAEIEAELARQQSSRQSRLGKIQQEAEAVKQFVQSTAGIDEGQINERIAQAVKQEAFGGIDESQMNDYQRGLLERIRKGQHTELSGDGRMLDRVIKSAFGDIINPQALQALGYNPEDFGTFDSSYGTGQVNLFGGGGSKMTYLTSPQHMSAGRLIGEIAAKARAYDPNAAIQKAFSDAGVDYGTYQSGSDLTAASVASEEQKRRYDALRRLAGISDQEAQKYTASRSNLASNYDKIVDAIRRQRGIERSVLA